MDQLTRDEIDTINRYYLDKHNLMYFINHVSVPADLNYQQRMEYIRNHLFDRS